MIISQHTSFPFHIKSIEIKGDHPKLMGMIIDRYTCERISRELKIEFAEVVKAKRFVNNDA